VVLQVTKLTKIKRSNEMEINITEMCKAMESGEDNLRNYQDSIMRSGVKNIGQITWHNALAAPYSFITDQTREATQEHFAGYGAWTEEEIAAWTDKELNGVLVQLIAGDLQEIKDQTDNSGCIYSSNGDSFYELSS